MHIRNINTFEEFKSLVEGNGNEDEGLYLNHLYPVSWTTGGQYGGSCWDEGESTYYPVDSEPEPEDTQLEKLLEVVFSNLTYLQFRKIEKLGFYEYDAETSNDYYGNHTDSSTRITNLEKLYNGLRKIAGE